MTFFMLLRISHFSPRMPLPVLLDLEFKLLDESSVRSFGLPFVPLSPNLMSSLDRRLLYASIFSCASNNLALGIATHFSALMWCFELSDISFKCLFLIHLEFSPCDQGCVWSVCSFEHSVLIPFSDDSYNFNSCFFVDFHNDQLVYVHQNFPF